MPTPQKNPQKGGRFRTINGETENNDGESSLYATESEHQRETHFVGVLLKNREDGGSIASSIKLLQQESEGCRRTGKKKKF